MNEQSQSPGLREALSPLRDWANKHLVRSWTAPTLLWGMAIFGVAGTIFGFGGGEMRWIWAATAMLSPAIACFRYTQSSRWDADEAWPGVIFPGLFAALFIFFAVTAEAPKDNLNIVVDGKGNFVRVTEPGFQLKAANHGMQKWYIGEAEVTQPIQVITSDDVTRKAHLVFTWKRNVEEIDPRILVATEKLSYLTAEQMLSDELSRWVVHGVSDVNSSELEGTLPNVRERALAKANELMAEHNVRVTSVALALVSQ